MDDQVRFLRKSFDSANRFLQSANDIGVSFLVKANMAVTDLHKGEVIPPSAAALSRGGREQHARRSNSTCHGEYQSRSCPSHALKEASAIHPVIVEIFVNMI